MFFGLPDNSLTGRGWGVDFYNTMQKHKKSIYKYLTGRGWGPCTLIRKIFMDKYPTGRGCIICLSFTKLIQEHKKNIYYSLTGRGWGPSILIKNKFTDNSLTDRGWGVDFYNTRQKHKKFIYKYLTGRGWAYSWTNYIMRQFCRYS